VLGLVAQVIGADIEQREGLKASITWLKDAGAQVERPPVIEAHVICKLPRRAFTLPAGVVFAPFQRWVSTARRYLETRKIMSEQVERWGLGYAVDGRLAGRIVIPVRNSLGRVISYAARAFTDAKKKYLAPDKSEGSTPGAVFGEQHWPAVGERKLLVLCEGGFDAIAVHNVTGGSVAAIFGSELLPAHLAKLSTFEEIVNASDPDAAGEKVWKALSMALARWVRMRRVEMPTGLDAAKLYQDDPERLRRLFDGKESNGPVSLPRVAG
jgi:DNA primase